MLLRLSAPVTQLYLIGKTKVNLNLMYHNATRFELRLKYQQLSNKGYFLY